MGTLLHMSTEEDRITTLKQHLEEALKACRIRVPSVGGCHGMPRVAIGFFMVDHARGTTFVVYTHDLRGFNIFQQFQLSTITSV